MKKDTENMKISKTALIMELGLDELECKDLMTKFKSREAIMALDKLKKALAYHRRLLK